MILQSSFANAFDSGSTTALFKIPSSVTEIAQYSLTNIRGAIVEMQFGEKEHGSHLRFIMTGDLLDEEKVSIQDAVISFSGTVPSVLNFYAINSTQLTNFEAWIQRGDATISALARIPTYNGELADDHAA